MEVSTVLGSVAAVFTPLLLATGFTLWDVHWTGSAVVLNALKGSVASVLFVIASVALLVGQVQGPGKSGFNAGMLVLSSVIGIVIGDTVWLQALELIGARRVILVDSIKPFLAAVLAVPIFNEPLRPLGILGMVVTMASVVLVSLENDKDETHPLVVEDRFKRLPHHEHEHQEEGLMESQFTTSGASIDENTDVVVLEGATDVENMQQSGEEAPVDQSVESQESLARINETATTEEHNNIAETPPAPASHLIGYCLSAVNVVLDVLGSVLTKKFGAGFNTFEVSGIRFGSAAIMLVSFLLGTRLYQRSYRRLSRKAPGLSNTEWWEFPSLSRTSLAFVMLGVISTTFGAVALSNFAIFQLPLATFSILTALTPIWSIPVVYFLKGERCSFRAIIGSLFAVAGIAPLYLEL